MFSALGRVLKNAAQETAVSTATTIASTAIALVTYNGASSTYGFFQNRLKQSPQTDLTLENSKQSKHFP